eukprot:4302258-Prymnesium_polylepis.2
MPPALHAGDSICAMAATSSSRRPERANASSRHRSRVRCRCEPGQNCVPSASAAMSTSGTKTL